MGIFSKRREYDSAKRGRALGQVPNRYAVLWKEDQRHGGGSTRRPAAVAGTIADVRSASSDDESLEAARALLPDREEAESFVLMVRAGQAHTLLALAWWETHKRIYPRALQVFLDENRFTEEEVFGSDEHDWELGAQCLVRLREFISLEVWDALNELSRAASHSRVYTPILEGVRTEWKENRPGMDVPFNFYDGLESS